MKRGDAEGGGPWLRGPAVSEADYLSSSLMAYIGNKRSLIPFLRKVFLELQLRSPIRSFLDPFAGTGSVSRLGRTLGWRVAANDIEPYSLAVNSCYLGVSADEAGELFRDVGGLGRAVELLNRLHPQREDVGAPGEPAAPYIALHYAPAETASADWRRERLFYTRENAVFLDRARQAIDELRPPRAGSVPERGPESTEEKERALLLGPLVYEAATHANTSGVFKACHKGFGGHGRDALGRILAPMSLEPPLLWPGPAAGLGRGDAAAFCLGRGADLCYLDPPYNQHQYGSNYHLLNTLVSWDRRPVDEERLSDGSLRSKAGIPPSWKERRSRFCSRTDALAAFKELLTAVDARFIVLSYNSEGIVPVDELYELLADRADVSLRSVSYTVYRGGRQSASRRTGNSEILFVAERRAGRGPAQPAAADRELGRLAAETRLARVLAGPFVPARLAGLASEDGSIGVESKAGRFVLSTYRRLLVEEPRPPLSESLGADEMRELADRLEPALARDNGEACEACALLLESGARDRRIQDLSLGWLRKLAHRKYSERFRELGDRFARCADAAPAELSRLRAGLAELRSLYEARTAGQSRAPRG
ncbi:MAG TPA: DNA adenine methylase [Rectinemataceae bacterium]|nr:DNA adenine methylase [Rectinemataceae bacterium]